MQAAAEQFRAKFPNAIGPKASFGVQLLQERMVRNVRTSLLVLVGAVSFVLLIACANVANLLLVRATARKREIAIRAAMGAGRGRIVRQLLTENVLLSLVGGALGLGLGIAGIRALLAVNPGNIPRIGADGSGVTADWRVVAFTVAVSLATGLVFGLFPALQASRVDLNLTLKESGGRSGSGFRQNKARSILVVAEVALALVLLVGASLLIRSFMALRAVNPGFVSQNVLTMRMSLTEPQYTKSAGVDQLIRAGAERVRSAARRRGGERHLLRAARRRLRPAVRDRRTAERGCRRTTAPAGTRSRRATSTSSGFRSCAAATSPTATRAAPAASSSSTRRWRSSSGRRAIR